MSKLLRILKVFREEGWSGVSRRWRYYLQAWLPWWENRRWIKMHTRSTAELSALSRQIESFSEQPLISILLPVYNTPGDLLRETIQSVLDQIYPNWELCIADDASTAPHIKPYLQEVAQQDSRIKVVFRPSNGHIAQASNSALQLVTGKYTALLDHDDLLTPDALYEVVSYINKYPDSDVIYSNEDKIDMRGRLSEPTFKASWSPDYFFSFMYMGHLTVYRTQLIHQAGGFRKGFEGSQDYDLALRVQRTGPVIRHLPRVLYHWRKHPESVAANIHAKPYAFESASKALKESFENRGFQGTDIAATRALGIYKVIRAAGQAQITALGVFERHDLAEDWLKKMSVEAADQPAFAICREAVGEHPQIIAGESLASALAQLSERICNSAIVILNPSLTPRPGAFDEILDLLGDPEIAIVTPKILSRRNRIIHAGCTLEDAVLSHNFFGFAEDSYGYGARLVSRYNVSAASELGVAMSADLLLREGNLDYASMTALLIDRCLTARAQGRRVTWTPFAIFDFSSENLPSAQQDLRALPDYDLLEKRFELSKSFDPFYPQGLDRIKRDYRVALG